MKILNFFPSSEMLWLWVFFLFCQIFDRFFIKSAACCAFCNKNWFLTNIIMSLNPLEETKRKKKRTKYAKQHELNNVPLYVCVCVSPSLPHKESVKHFKWKEEEKKQQQQNIQLISADWQTQWICLAFNFVSDLFLSR